jgi:choline dehydrogenase-like flavoprotein
MVGGATGMYCGCAAPPPPWLKQRHGVDVEAEAAEMAAELEVAPLSPELRGAASTRIAEAADALGQQWYPQPKFLRPARAPRFPDACGARCMLGCRCGAKWSAAEFVDQARAKGANLVTRARARQVLIEEGRVTGVTGTLGSQSFVVRADTVVLAAGGIGTPRILQASGLKGAGEGMTMDTTAMVYGLAQQPGNGNEPPMTWSWDDPQGEFMLSTLIDPWLLYPFVAAFGGARHALRWPSWNRMLGVMIKVRDEVSGGVSRTAISKPLTERDRARMAEAEQLCRRILVKAGAEPSSLFTTPLRGTHPSGTVRIGAMLDANLATEVRGLYVCDASVFPEALGRPTVLTIIALAKRLARHLGAA